MGWPLSQDYNEAVQNPRTSFADPELQAGEAVPGPFGLPRPRSGNFADVYQVRGPGGAVWAVKCFTRQVPGLQERYARIAAHLRQARLPFTVRFTFLENGLRVRGAWYPVLKMQWVEGFTLNEFVRTHADRPDYLRALLGLWARLGRRLRDARVAHADLQHGNILLVPATSANKLGVRLIDYDGMWTPALATTPSGEVGHPAYQHPARGRDRLYSADVDRFPHLVIATALRATAVAGKRLWDEFDNGDNLLFRETDLAAPERSALYRTLWDLDDPTVTNLVALLIESCDRPLPQTVWLDEVLTGTNPASVEDRILGRAAERLGVVRRVSGTVQPTAEVFSVPEQATEFGEIADADRRAAPSPRPYTRRLPLVFAGGGLVVLALFALIASLGPGTPPPDPPADGTAGIRVPGIGTAWVAIPAGPPLPRGADVADDLLKRIPDRGSRPIDPQHGSNLGAWLLADGDRAVFATTNAVGIVRLMTGETDPIVRSVGDLVRVAVGADGKFVVTAGADRVVRCWDAETVGGEVWVRSFPGTVSALEITPDGRRVAATGEGVGYLEWGLADGTELRRHESFRALRFAFSDDGRRAIAARADEVSVWNLDDGVTTLLAPGFVAAGVCVTSGSRALAIASGGEIKSWELTTGKAFRDRLLHVRGLVTTLAGGGDAMIVGTDEGEIVTLRPDGTASTTTLTGPPQSVSSLVPTRNGRHALAGMGAGPAHLVRLRTAAKVGPLRDPNAEPNPPFRIVREFVGPGEALGVGLSADGDRMLVATAARAVWYQTSDFKNVGELSADADRVLHGAALVGNGLVLSDARVDRSGGRVRAFDPTGKQVGADWALPTPRVVTNLQPVPNRPWVLADIDGIGVVLFDVPSGKPADGFRTDPPIPLRKAVPDAEGKNIACIRGNGLSSRLSLWSAETKSFGRPLAASAGVAQVAFAPGGRVVVGAWDYGRIKVWEVATGDRVREVDHDGVGLVRGIQALSEEAAILEIGNDRAGLDLTTGKYFDLVGIPNGRPTWLPHRAWVTTVSPAGRVTVLKADLKAAVRLAEVPAPRFPGWEAKLVRDAVAGPPADLVFSADGIKVTVGTTEGRLIRYSADRLLLDRESDTGEPALTGLGRGPDRIYTHGPKFGVRSWDDETLEKVQDFPTTTGPAKLFGVRPDGGAFYFGTDRLTETDVKTRVKKAVPASPLGGGPRTQIAFSSDGDVMVSRWTNGYLAAFKRSKREEKRFDKPEKAPLPAGQAIAVSADGNYAVLGTNDGRVTVWHTPTGKIQFSEVGHHDGETACPVTAAEFLPAGRTTRFLTTGTDGRTVLWGLSGDRRVKEFIGLPGNRKLRIAPGGRTAVVHGPTTIEVLDLP